MSGWIGVDLDGVLAQYGGVWSGGIGPPVPAMVERVKRWLAEGCDVRIFTARVAICHLYSSESGRVADEKFASEQADLIRAWCIEHIGVVLPVTAVKDFACEAIYDDRARQVEMNTGRIIGESAA